MNLEIIGNLGNDAEHRSENGKDFVLFSVACTDSYTRNDGTKVENTTWVNCILNGDGGNLLKYLVRGTRVFCRGRQSLRVYSSAKDRCMKAGVDLNVKEIELVGGRSEDVPAQLVDEAGMIYDVHKAYYLLKDNDGKLPTGQLRPARGRGTFTCNQDGWLYQTSTETESEQSEQETASDNNVVGTQTISDY